MDASACGGGGGGGRKDPQKDPNPGADAAECGGRGSGGIDPAAADAAASRGLDRCIREEEEDVIAASA